MSGGQDDAAGQIESSGGKLPVGLREIEMTKESTKQVENMIKLRRLLEACSGDPVLESQLKERIEDAEDDKQKTSATPSLTRKKTIMKNSTNKPLHIGPQTQKRAAETEAEDPGLYSPTVEELKEIDPWYKEHAE